MFGGIRSLREKKSFTTRLTPRPVVGERVEKIVGGAKTEVAAERVGRGEVHSGNVTHLETLFGFSTNSIYITTLHLIAAVNRSGAFKTTH